MALSCYNERMRTEFPSGNKRFEGNAGKAGFAWPRIEHPDPGNVFEAVRDNAFYLLKNSADKNFINCFNQAVQDSFNKYGIRNLDQTEQSWKNLMWGIYKQEKAKKYH